MAGGMVYTCNPNTQEAELRQKSQELKVTVNYTETQKIWGQPGLHKKRTFSPRSNDDNNKMERLSGFPQYWTATLNSLDRSQHWLERSPKGKTLQNPPNALKIMAWQEGQVDERSLGSGAGGGGNAWVKGVGGIPQS